MFEIIDINSYIRGEDFQLIKIISKILYGFMRLEVSFKSLLNCFYGAFCHFWSPECTINKAYRV